MRALCAVPVLCPQVLLCEETVSLLGIRQFYKLVGDAGAAAADTPCADAAVKAQGSPSSSPSCSTGQETEQPEPVPCAGTAVAAPTAAVLINDAAAKTEVNGHANHAAPSTTSSASPQLPPWPQPAASEVTDGAHAQQREREGKKTGSSSGSSGSSSEPQLTFAEQQQLLSLKVDALLQLLSSVSFHQVGTAAYCCVLLRTALH